MPTFEISYHDYNHVSHVHGATRGAAKYSKFLDLDGAVETFRDFQRMVKSVRKVGPQANAYDYIERQYGRKFRVGEIVTVTGEGAEIEGRSVEVVHPQSSGCYVNVLLDGAVALMHPMSLTQRNSLTPTDRPANASPAGPTKPPRNPVK